MTRVDDAITVMVHEMASDTRIRVVEPLTWPVQARAEEFDGNPRTLKMKGLPDMAKLPLVRRSITWNVDCAAVGDETTKAKLEPPLLETSDGLPTPPAEYVGARKSELRPTAEPSVSRTVIEQEMSSDTRTYVSEALACPTQASVDAMPGEETLNENGLPPEMRANVVDSFSVTRNMEFAASGAEKANVKLVPPPCARSVGVPRPPVEYVGIEKSVERPATLWPLGPMAAIVQLISSLMRTTVVDPLVAPEHDNSDCAVEVMAAALSE